jgi:phage I-like protein
MNLLYALLAASLALPGELGHAQLLPAGEFAARDGRPGLGKTWKLDDAQGEALAAAMNAEAGRTPIVIDYDHRTLYAPEKGGEAPAAGWILSVQWRAGAGLFAKVDWTDAAKARITQREYRYISPVILSDPGTGRIVKVALAALVNYPALLGMEPVLAALSTRFPQEQASMNPILVALLAGLGLAETATQEQALSALSALKARPEKAGPLIPAALATELGVAGDATEAAVLAAVSALKAPDSAGLQAMQALQAEVAQLRAQVEGDKLSGLVDKAIADGKLLPAQRDWALGLGRKDMAQLSAFIAAAPVIAGLGGQTGGQNLGSSPAGGGGGQPDALAGQVMQQFGLTAEQFAAGKPKAAA